MNNNSRLLQTLQLQPNTAHIPVWLLRQVGRYMPQYQKLKQQRDLFSLFHDTQAICDATLLAPELLHVDAAILFADILSICDGFRIPYTFNPGPQIQFSMSDPLQFTSSPKPFQYLLDAIQSISKQITIPLIGFAASPFTLLSFLLEQGGSKNYHYTMSRYYQHPEWFQSALLSIAQATAQYLQWQIEAGCQVIQLFESSAYCVPDRLFQQLVVHPNRILIDQLRTTSSRPIMLFCRTHTDMISQLHDLPIQAIHPDFTVSIEKICPHRPLVIQGNFDPALLLTDPDTLEQHLEKYLASMPSHFIFNIGHGIHPKTPLEHVQMTVRYVHQYRSAHPTQTK